LSNNTTIYALSTPAGSGALGVIRLSGLDALTITQKIIDRNIQQIQANKAVFCRIIENKTVIDEVVLTYFKGPHSFTGEDTIEISCHGSAYIIQEILRLIHTHGGVMAQPGEFTMRAFFNNKMDLSQAEAVADLIASETKASHTIAMNQMRGGFSNEIKMLRENLIDFASLIELELDFAEEDVEFADRTKLRELLKQLLESIKALKDSFELGNAIKNGIPVAIVGKPNAGKSSWINALTADTVAIVSDIAGTTRDKIEVPVNINGILFRLIDTAGLRETTDTIEKIGVATALEVIKKASVLLYIFDINTTSLTDLEIELSKLEQLNEGATIISVANKIDVLNDGQKTKQFSKSIHLSAHNTEHIQELKKALSSKFDISNLGHSVVTSARHASILSNAYDALLNAQTAMDNGSTGDILAMDIRSAIHYLGEITGTISTEDLLGNIFGKFCIGK